MPTTIKRTPMTFSGFGFMPITWPVIVSAHQPEAEAHGRGRETESEEHDTDTHHTRRSGVLVGGPEAKAATS